MHPSAAGAVVLQNAENLMKETMARYDPSHDALHVQRVRKTAIQIARQDVVSAKNPDYLVIELAALLHDVLDKKYVSEEQAADPYSFFLPFFQEQDHRSPEVKLVSSGKAHLISRIVENVSWTTEKKLRASGGWTEWHESCIELHCVQDADRLDAIGAFGIMRCAAYSAVVNRPLHDPSRPNDTAIGHFHDKLLHIKDRLKTEPGKKMGERRHKAMLDFLASIEEEYTAEL